MLLIIIIVVIGWLIFFLIIYSVNVVVFLDWVNCCILIGEIESKVVLVVE